MTLLRALVIDEQRDEPGGLRNLLKEYQDVVVVGETGQPGRAHTLLSVANYDVVFFNPELNGCDALDLLPSIRPVAQVVFVTTQACHALRAFDVQAVDYLLQPVQPQRLARAIERVRRLTAAPATGSATPFANMSGLLPVKVGPVTRLLRIDDLKSIASCQNYTEVSLAGTERLLVRRTMQEWADALPEAQFARVHRSLFVNLARVNRTEPAVTRKRKLYFTADDSEPLIVKRRHWPALRAKLAHWQCPEFAPGDSNATADGAGLRTRPRTIA